MPDTFDSLAGQRIVVTGASGYLAWNAIRAIEGVPCELVRASRSDLAPFVGREGSRISVRDVRIDLARAAPEEITGLLAGVDTVLHLGAQTSVYRANEAPLADFEANVLPFHRMLEAARASGASPFFILAASATQFGIPQRIPVDESHPDAPVTVYCAHKLFAEHYLELYCRLGWARGCSFRLSNVYGPGPRSSSADRGVLNQMIQKAMRGEPLTLFGAGEQLRDYIHVDDVTSAFWMAAGAPERVNGRHFVLSSGTGTSLRQAFEAVSECAARSLGRAVEVKTVAPPAGTSSVDSRHFVGDTKALRHALGWAPRIPLEQGIRQTMDQLRDLE